MKTILIIDDEKDIANIVKDAIELDNPDVDCIVELDFDEGTKKAGMLRPDAIVLDLMEGNRSINLPGQKTWAAVWEKNFCPVVIYTGWEAEIVPPVPANHPFVQVVKKGRGSQERVVEKLKGFLPALEAVRLLRAEVDAVIHRVLRDTAGRGTIPIADKAHLLHAGRRRIAASMDDPTITSERPLMSWEQYLVPAIGDSPLTADLLRKRGAEWNEPDAYRLVLTPSCDLVKGRCEPTLIVACCEGPTGLARKLSLALSPKKSGDDAKNVISKALTAGAFAGFLPLPSFPELLPVMVANLKNLQVLCYNEVVANEGAEPGFERIASIDSPFREQVAWAYLTTAARPGMPERDLKPWAEEIVNAAIAAGSQAPAPPSDTSKT